MTENAKNAVKAAGSAAAGGVAGASIYGVIGGIGVAAGGTAVGISLGPFIAIGSGVGLAGYGIYWLGKQVGGRKPPPPPAGEPIPADRPQDPRCNSTGRSMPGSAEPTGDI
jgi:hypothetical protein